MKENEVHAVKCLTVKLDVRHCINIFQSQHPPPEMPKGVILPHVVAAVTIAKVTFKKTLSFI